MKKLFTALFLMLTLWGRSQTYDFAVSAGGTDYDELIELETDGNGNIYALAKYKTNFTAQSSSFTGDYYNYVLMKYNVQGDLLASRDFKSGKNSTSGNFVGGIGVSETGEVYIGGETFGLEDVGYESVDWAFVAKLKSDLSIDWLISPEPVLHITVDKVTALTVKGDEVYVGFEFTDANGMSLGGVRDDFSNEAAYNDYVALAKLQSDGSVNWMRYIPNAYEVNSKAMREGLSHILASEDGSVYAAGKSGGEGSYNDYFQAFLSKFSADGTQLWTRGTSTAGAKCWGLVETSAGNLVMGFDYQYGNQVDFRTGVTLAAKDYSNYGMVATFNPDGDVLGIQQFSDIFATDPTNLNYVSARQMALNEADQLVFACKVSGANALNNNVDLSADVGLISSHTIDAGVLFTSLSLEPVTSISHTGKYVEEGTHVVLQNNNIIFGGTYSIFSHPFYGVIGPDFGGTTFTPVGANDIFIASVTNGTLTNREEPELAHPIQVYPNPFYDQLTIINPNKEAIAVKLMNVSGQILLSFKLDAKEQQQISTQHLKKGAYVLKAGKESTKIIK